MKDHLSPTTMLELEEMFQKMNWKIDKESDVNKSLYGRYCEILKLLSDEEQNLFIDLSFRFEQVGIVDYLNFFLNSYNNIESDKLALKENIIFYPLTMPFVESPDDIEDIEKIERPKTKSSQFLYYYLDANDLNEFSHYSKFEFLESITAVKESFTNNETLLVLIDDFIGSGKTAVTCINSIKSEIEKNNVINFNDICIVSIAAQQEGVKKVYDDLGVKVYSEIIRQKGITDYYSTNVINHKKGLMLNIEKKLKCPSKYSLGFKKSEALITFMNKTPNNTFPAFWYGTEKRIAPFPRYKKTK